MESQPIDRISDLKVSNSDDHSHDQDQDQQQQPQTQPKREETLTTTPQKNIVVPDITTPSKEDHKATSLADEELVFNNNNNVEDDDDGFKTPTGLQHKIPVMTECPPAPRKSRRLLRKRKVSSTSAPGRMIQPASFDLQQLQAFFAPTFLLPDLRAKIKKARRD